MLRQRQKALAINKSTHEGSGGRERDRKSVNGGGLRIISCV